MGNFDDSCPVEVINNLAKTMAEADIRLVCSGNGSNVLVNLVDAIITFGGKVTYIATNFHGINSKLIDSADEVLWANDLHRFKMLLFYTSDGVAFLPDGIATLDVLMEYLTWMQRVYHSKPVYIVESGKFSAMLTDMFARMDLEGFLPENFRQRSVRLNSLDELIIDLKKMKEV